MWDKVERAEKDIEELKAAIEAFQATKPYRFFRQLNPDIGEHREYLLRIDPVPADISVKIRLACPCYRHML